MKITEYFHRYEDDLPPDDIFQEVLFSFCPICGDDLKINTGQLESEVLCEACEVIELEEKFNA